MMSMKKILNIKAQPMNEEIMAFLEEKGCIMRLLPSRPEHRLNVKNGEGRGDYLYRSNIKYGGHSLVNVAIDNKEFKSFGYHPDNEEFLLLGGIGEKQMYLLVSLIDKDEFEKRILNNSLKEDCFVCLKVVYNDPNLSFFVMNKNIPHGECVIGDEGKPATFYVTEGGNLPLNLISFGNYQIIINT